MTKARTVGQKRRGRPRKEGPRAQPVNVAAPKPVLTGPTPEQMAKGGYTRPKEETGVLVVFTNIRENPLGQLLGFGTITKRQAAGGLMFIEDHSRAWPSGGRDSTQPIIGGRSHETDAEAKRIATARERLDKVLNRCGPKAYSILSAVAVFGYALGKNRGKNRERYDALKTALDACAAVYGVDA